MLSGDWFAVSAGGSLAYDLLWYGRLTLHRLERQVPQAIEVLYSVITAEVNPCV